MTAASIRVLHCIHSLRGGGAERQLNLLAEYSRHSQISHAVFCVSSAGLQPGSVFMPVFEASSKARWNWKLGKDLLAVIGRFRPHVVHCWLPASMTVPAMLLARLRGKRVVFSFRNQMIFNRPLAVLEWLVALLFSNAVISNTPVEDCAPQFRFLYRLKRGVHIPNGASSVGTPGKSSWRIAAGEPLRILFVGRLAPDKNVDCVLTALTKVPELSWRLTICGVGGEADRLRQKARDFGIDAHIDWLGFRDDVPMLMARSDVLVLPSWREGTPNVVMEAMMIGLPCIVSRIAGNLALLGNSEAALLFDPSSPGELAELLE
jgi:glycosyltransferase involved in cell wall biosynthesis